MGRRRSFLRHMARVRRRALTLQGVVGSTIGVGLTLAAPEAWAQTSSPSKPAEGAPEVQSKDDMALPGINVQGERDQYNQFKIEQPSLYKLPDPIQDTPQSITVIPEKIMEERAFFTLRDALRTVPGVAIAAGEGGGRQGDNLTLRGFPAGNDIFIDGVRDLGQYTRDTFNLEAIEVLKGPSSIPVRTRLDGRRHQPGHEDAEAHAVLRGRRHRGRAGPFRTRDRGSQLPLCELRRRAPEPAVLQG